MGLSCTDVRAKESHLVSAFLLSSCVSCSCYPHGRCTHQEGEEEQRLSTAEETRGDGLGSRPAGLIKHNVTVNTGGLFLPWKRDWGAAGLLPLAFLLTVRELFVAIYTLWYLYIVWWWFCITFPSVFIIFFHIEPVVTLRKSHETLNSWSIWDFSSRTDSLVDLKSHEF